MTFNTAIAQVRPCHLMVRSESEWDALALPLRNFHHGKDEELIGRLVQPFLQSWRTITTHLLQDTFDAAGIAVSAPEHPWGIAILTANGNSCEPLLYDSADTVRGPAQAIPNGPLRLLTSDETITRYTTSLRSLPVEDLQLERNYKPAKSHTETQVQPDAPASPVRRVFMNPVHAAALDNLQSEAEDEDESFSK